MQKERISALGDRTFEIIQLEDQKKKNLKKCEESQWDLKDTIKRNSIPIMGFSEREEKGTESNNIFKAIGLKSSQTWKEKWTSMSKEPQTG